MKFLPYDLRAFGSNGLDNGKLRGVVFENIHRSLAERVNDTLCRRRSQTSDNSRAEIFPYCVDVLRQ